MCRKVCDMHTFRKYAKYAAIVYLHKTNMPGVEIYVIVLFYFATAITQISVSYTVSLIRQNSQMRRMLMHKSDYTCINIGMVWSFPSHIICIKLHEYVC